MTTKKRIGFAVVGLGHISEIAVLPAFQHSKKAKVVALVSGDAQKARRLAKKFGASDYYSYEDYVLALNHPKVDAVFIATTNGTHAEYAMRAAQSGKHVLCEKPMANSVAECQEMIAACRAHDVRLMIAYRKYVEPASILLKRLVASGRLGRLKTIHSAFTFTLPFGTPAKPGWHFNRKQAGGGSLVDVGVYCVNAVRWMIGRNPVEASGYAWTHHPDRYREVEEHMAFELKFPDGVLLQASCSFGAAQSSFLHIIGDKGWAALNPAYEFAKQRRMCGEIGGRWFEKRFPPMDEFALELDTFAQAIARGRDPGPDGTEGLKDVAIMQAIYRASQEGRPVPISLS
jgi:predicted dehydrogenase